MIRSPSREACSPRWPASSPASAASGLTAFELEELLDEPGREVIRQLLQDHLDLRAAREEQQAREQRAPAAGPGGIARTRLESGHGRLLSTLFGPVTVTRCAWRMPGAPSWCPAGAALSLPAGRHSRSLAKLAATGAARGSFDAAHDAIARRCGNVIGKRQLEQAGTGAAADIPAFCAARVPQPCTPETLVVLSAGGKGIVMRPGALRAATAKAAARLGKMRTRLPAGEKPNRKRMACLVTVYDAVPAERRPHDVIAPPGGRHGARTPRPGPEALARRLAGSVRNDPAEVIAAAFGEAEARDPGHLRTRVVLADGAEHQLDLIRAEAAPPAWPPAGGTEPAPASATSAPGTSTSATARPSQTAAPSPPASSREPAGTSQATASTSAAPDGAWTALKPSLPSARSSATATSRSTGDSTSNASTSTSTPALSRDNTRSAPNWSAHSKRATPI
jgi:hypothetical protein